MGGKLPANQVIDYNLSIMPRILVDPLDLKETASRFSRCAASLQSLGARLSSLWSNLEANSAQSLALSVVESDWLTARRQMQLLTEQSQELAHTLQLYAAKFEEADRAGVTSLAGVAAGFSKVAAASAGLWIPLQPMIRFPQAKIAAQLKAISPLSHSGEKIPITSTSYLRQQINSAQHVQPGIERHHRHDGDEAMRRTHP